VLHSTPKPQALGFQGEATVKAKRGKAPDSARAAAIACRNAERRAEEGRAILGTIDASLVILDSEHRPLATARRSPALSSGAMVTAQGERIALPRDRTLTAEPTSLRGGTDGAEVVGWVSALGNSALMLEARERVASPPITAPPQWRLTKREREVLAAFVQGKSIAEAADALGMAPATARVHVRRMLSKAGAHSLRQLLSRCLGAE
jgi:DNA-binding CsgD family transcriptional regulator